MASIVFNANNGRVQSNLHKIGSSLEKTLGRIASGHRVNSAGDDAAALAISEGLRAELRSTRQAERNVNDGISLLQTADAALSQTGDLLARSRELAVQSANDTLSDEQRQSIQTEFNQLRAEIDRIAGTTEFNGKQLLDGSGGSTDLQVGPDSGDQISVSATDATASSIGIGTTDLSSKAGALAALSEIDSAMASVSASRGELGASQNRLAITAQSLSARAEATTASRSRLIDADFALETANLVSQQIQNKAAISVLGISKRSPAAFLDLLK